MTRVLLHVMGLLLLLSPAFAQGLADHVPSIDVVRARLNLTPQQEARLQPLFQQRAADLEKTRAKLDQATTPAARRAVLREAQLGAHSFNARVESELDTSQKSGWRELRQETREKLEERYQQRRESQ
jgi:Skp family chaperone for outer membrane proteins